MKKIMLALLLAAGLSNGYSQTESYNSQTYLEQHIAIVSTKVRVVSSAEYVVEIKLKDYSGQAALPQGFGSEERVYADDGRGFDLSRADGTFTSKEKYPFKTSDRSNLESNIVLYNPGFQHKIELENDLALQAKTKTACKFVKVGCPPSNGGNCPACRWWGWSCWELIPCGTGFDF